MYKAQVQKNDEILTLTGVENKWQIISIGGLNPPSAQLNMTQISGMDGARFNSSKLNTRNLVITIRINGTVYANRKELQDFFVTKEQCRFLFENGNGSVYIDGYVESLECDPFTASQIMQISMICPDPYFRSTEAYIVAMSNTLAGFMFPFSIEEGEPIVFSTFESSRITTIDTGTPFDTGVEIAVEFSGNVSSFLIANTTSGETIRINYAFQNNDVLYINTIPDSLAVRVYRSGTWINLFPYLATGSKLLTLHPGDNEMGFSADSHDHDDRVEVALTYRKMYGGM